MYAPKIIRRRFHWPTAVATLLLCVAAGTGVILIAGHAARQVPLPGSIRSAVQFPVLLPATEVVVDQHSYKYDVSQQVLSFTGHLTDGQAVTFAEQPTPSSFTDIPNFYQKFLQQLYEYESFDGLNGTVHITHPKGAGQAAVLNTKGTLVFARVARDEPKATWQRVFNDLGLYVP